MATTNSFDLLGGDDAEDPSLLIAAQQQKTEPKKAAAPSSKAAVVGAKAAAKAKLPSKPLPPAQAVEEGRSESSEGGRGGGRGYGRVRGASGGFYRDSTSNESSYGNREFYAGQGGAPEADVEKPYERRRPRGGYGGPREPSHDGRRGDFSNGDRTRRQFDRHSGTGQGNEIKREGSGQGNWGTDTDARSEIKREESGQGNWGTDTDAQSEIKHEGSGQGNWGTETDAQVAEGGGVEGEKGVISENPSEEEKGAAADGDKEAAKDEAKVEKPRVQEMTLAEYEKILEDKRKALQALKTESRKVDTKEFESMQPLSNKKTNDDIFIKLGAEKDKKKELAEKEERAKKSVSINEFLKPAKGQRYHNPRRDQGRDLKGGEGGGSETSSSIPEPDIKDPGQFPTLGGK
ncbi:hypothetical protein OROHE_004865 [Orobanche hederae]